MKTKILLLIFLLLLSCGSPKSKKAASETTMEPVPVEESAGDGYYDDPAGDSTYEMEESMPEYELQEIFPSPPPPIQQPTTTQSSGTAVHNTETAVNTFPNIVVQKYEMGKLVYNIPNEMIKLNTYTVVARIQRNLVDLKIYDGMQITVDTIIRTSETMKVDLVDPTGTNFKIVSNSSTQYIELNEHTEWNFYVTPLVRGESELKIIVSIIKNGVPREEVYSDNILVKTTTWIEIKLFLQSYWQWFLTIAIIPLLGYIRKIYILRKKNQ